MTFTARRIVVAFAGVLLLAGMTGALYGELGGSGQRVLRPADEPAGAARWDGRLERVLIRAAKPYDTLCETIRSRGGKVDHEYRHFDGVAAQIPRGALGAIVELVGAEAIAKDLVIRVPDAVDRGVARADGPVRSGDERTIDYESARPAAAADIAALAARQPQAYVINNETLGADALHAAGIFGQGVIVGVIDSGIRPGYFHLESDGSVIGGEDFVGDGRGFSHVQNSGHGTFVAGMISANAFFGFNPTSTFFRAVQAYAPAAILDDNGTPVIPMIGSAPSAKIFALRVFGPSGGSPTSVVLAAVDRAIELRRKFDAGEPGGVNIRVVNMSLSGPTLFAGRDFFDMAVDAMVGADIVVTNSAGNAGPSSLTIGSPGSSIATVTVGAASLAHNERIARDLQFGSGIGGRFRPFGGVQTAVFSSRGPNADGRGDPDVTANGDWCFGMGFGSPAQVSFAGGTSFSAPTVAGVAALLRQAFPGATAVQVRNAIIESTDPGLIQDGSTALDQGRGYVNAQAAFDLLARGKVSKKLPRPPKFGDKVKSNLRKNAGLRVEKDVVAQRFERLRPGERGEIIYDVPPDTSRVVIGLSNVMPELPPAMQNVFFGDDILLTVHSAKTSRQPGEGDYLIDGFTLGGTFQIFEPERGLMRVTLNGDWTNAGGIAADVTIFSERERLPGASFEGKIVELQTIEHLFQVPAGVGQAKFRLIWHEDWSRYPVNDIDLVLVTPNGTPIFDGATLAEPEVVVVNNPPPGEWTAILFGFELHTPDDKYKLRITLDGNLLLP